MQVCVCVCVFQLSLYEAISPVEISVDSPSLFLRVYNVKNNGVPYPIQFLPVPQVG